MRTHDPMPPVVDFGETSLENGEVRYRWDYSEVDAKGQWSMYVSAQEMLRARGWQLVDPYSEHDCLTGKLEPLTQEDE